MRAKHCLVLILALALSGCSAIPLSTMWKLHGFGQKDFEALVPAELRVRVSVPEGSLLAPGKAEFKVAVKAGAKTFERTFALAAVSESTVTETSGFFVKRRVAWDRTVLKLTDESIARFAELQTFVKGPGKKEVSLNVSTPLKRRPAKPTEVVLTVDILLTPKGGYFTLLDHASFTIEARDAQYQRKKGVGRPTDATQ